MLFLNKTGKKWQFQSNRKKWKIFQKKKKGGNLIFKRATTWHETRNQPQKEQWGKKQLSSVQFSCSINSLWPHGLQQVRLPCSLPTLGACSDLCPLSWWCHPTISSPVVCFSSCLQSFPTSGSFPMSHFFTSAGQNSGASASVLPMYIQCWFHLGMAFNIFVNISNNSIQVYLDSKQFQ